MTQIVKMYLGDKEVTAQNGIKASDESFGVVKYDGVTLDENASEQLELKDGGVTDAKIDDDLKATSISDDPVDTKLATEKAVSNFVKDNTVSLDGSGLKSDLTRTIVGKMVEGRSTRIVFFGQFTAAESPNGQTWAFEIIVDNVHEGNVNYVKITVNHTDSSKVWFSKGSYNDGSSSISWTNWETIEVPMSEVDKKEDKTNKTTTLTSSSTDTQYPSAKAVYNFVQGNNEIFDLGSSSSGTLTSAQITKISANPSGIMLLNDDHYYRLTEDSTPLLTYSYTTKKTSCYIMVSTSNGNWNKQIFQLEGTDNKVTTVSSSSTDDQYPSAKAVYTGLASKASTAVATTSANGLMSSTDKTKLDGVETGAQKNTITGVKGSAESTYRTGNVNITAANVGLGNVDNTSDATKKTNFTGSIASGNTGFVTGGDAYTALAGKAGTSVATTSANGLMSSIDKTKLDGIETGAQKNTITGVKGNSESSYRTGNVNITASNIGLGSVVNTGDSATPTSGGTTKFTTGGAYTELNKKENTSNKVTSITSSSTDTQYPTAKAVYTATTAGTDKVYGRQGNSWVEFAPEEVTGFTLHSAVQSGSIVKMYRIGKMVYVFFNAKITFSASSGQYVKLVQNIPEISNATFSAILSDGTNILKLAADGRTGLGYTTCIRTESYTTIPLGWYYGFIMYIAK